jgi:hypothetical protein
MRNVTTAETALSRTMLIPSRSTLHYFGNFVRPVRSNRGFTTRWSPRSRYREAPHVAAAGVNQIFCALDAAGLVRSRNELVAGRVIRGEYRWNKESSGQRSGLASSRVKTSGAWTQMRVTARQPFGASGAKCRGC